MFTIPMGMMLGADISVGLYIRKAMIAACIGNIAGAWLLSLSFFLLVRAHSVLSRCFFKERRI